eukprot:1189134-Prorocentrum_minimum.AAC.2
MRAEIDKVRPVGIIPRLRRRAEIRGEIRQDNEVLTRLRSGVWWGRRGSPGAISWQPGILAVVLQGRTSDALGLADFLFPSILAGFCLRYDSAIRRVGSRPSSILHL